MKFKKYTTISVNAKAILNKLCKNGGLYDKFVVIGTNLGLSSSLLYAIYIVCELTFVCHMGSIMSPVTSSIDLSSMPHKQ